MPMMLEPANSVTNAQRRIPFAALMVPIDIKHQYSPEEIANITSCQFFVKDEAGVSGRCTRPDPTIAICEVEFDSEFVDVWEIDLRFDLAWSTWFGWAKVDTLVND